MKTYPQFLEIGHLTEHQRNDSLNGVFRRDIEEHPGLSFLGKIIRPIKGEEPAMELLFRHLTTEEVWVNDELGNAFSKRVFELERSVRLHWIRHHLEGKKKDNVEIFIVTERDQKKRRDITRTYIYDVEQKYIIVLDPHRSSKDYYLLTAYYLNKEYGERKINKLLKKKLSGIC